MAGGITCNPSSAFLVLTLLLLINNYIPPMFWIKKSIKSNFTCLSCPNITLFCFEHNPRIGRVIPFELITPIVKDKNKTECESRTSPAKWLRNSLMMGSHIFHNNKVFYWFVTCLEFVCIS